MHVQHYAETLPARTFCGLAAIVPWWFRLLTEMPGEDVPSRPILGAANLRTVSDATAIAF